MSAGNPVKVYLSEPQKRILKIICARLGMDESAALRHFFLEYAKDVNLVTEAVHGRLQ